MASKLGQKTLVVAVLALVGAAAPAARADATKSECIEANAKGQDARRDHRFATARTLLTQCSQPSCPAMVRDDCTKRLDELERSQPTIVFSVTDAAGRDLVNVKVSVDGTVLADKVDGTALNVDPGARMFTFEAPGHPPFDQTIVIREGEKERNERVILGSAEAAPPAPTPAAHGAQLVVTADEAATIVVDGSALAKGRFDGPLLAGTHDVQVTEPGKADYSEQVELHEGETRRLDVTLVEAKRAPVWPWLVAGGVVVVAGAAVGGYFLFRTQDTQPAALNGSLGSLRFTAWSL